MDRHKTPHRPAAADWHKADIKAALEKAGWSLRSLASHLQLNPAGLSQALRGPYPAAEKRIADAIGLHPMVLWPTRYSKNGDPIDRRCNPYWSARRNRSTRTPAVNVKSARAR